MRIVNTTLIKDAIKNMCIEANHTLSLDMELGIKKAKELEQSPIGIQILKQIDTNMSIAKDEKIPICQDTGMVTVFLKVGQEVYFEGDFIEDAVNQGIRAGYGEGYLRKSVVGDPIHRINTKDNTPGIIHIEIVKGSQIEIIVAPKGFGSENMSKVYMLKPSDGIEGIRKAVVETVIAAGPNACPPVVVGVGIGGNFEKAAILSKKALLRDINIRNEKPHLRELEESILEEINKTGIGPAGLGGRVTALCVNINEYSTHIAGLPLAVNLCCHVNRHVRIII